MEESMYVEQLIRQQNIHRISAVLAVVFFCAAGILMVTGYKQKGVRYRLFAVLTLVILSCTTGLQRTFAAPAQVLDAAVAEVGFTITQRQENLQGQNGSSEKNYSAPVKVEVFWRNSGPQEEPQELHIEFSGEKYAESLALDPGFGTSIKEQLEYLGISWVTLLSETGIAESSEGKRIEFQVEEEGEYSFEGAGRVLAFSIGDRKQADDLQTSETMGNQKAEGTGNSANVTEQTEEPREDGNSATNKKEDGKEEKEPDEVVKDEEAPFLSVFLAPSKSGGNLFSASESPRLSIQARDSISGLRDISYRVENLHTGESVEKTLHVSEEKNWSSELQMDQKELGEGPIQIRIQATDLVGNTSPWESINLEIDRTAPVIRFQGVTNAAAYSSAVTPVIKVSDSALSLADLHYSLKGARSGWLDPALLSDVALTKNGIAITMSQFPNEIDDVYTLSVQAEDQAGNKSEEEIVFSLDQNGSSYIFSDATKELVQDYYTKEPIDLVLSEINTSAINYAVSVSKDGVPRDLEEDKDYRVEVRGGDGDWLIYTYHIFASNFQEEGVYHVDIMSRDQASNVNDSQARGARIDFVVQRDGEEKERQKKEKKEEQDKKNTAESKKKQEKLEEKAQDTALADSLSTDSKEKGRGDGESAENEKKHISFPAVFGVMGLVLLLAILGVCLFRYVEKRKPKKGEPQ